MSEKKNPAAVALGRLGGAANTPAQLAAKKRNARLAGRPGRICSTCHEPVFGWHKDRERDDTCPGVAWEWQTVSAKRAKKTPKRKAG